MFSAYKVVEMRESALCKAIYSLPIYVCKEHAVKLMVDVTEKSSCSELMDIYNAPGHIHGMLSGIVNSIATTVHLMLEPHKFLERRGLSDDFNAFTALLDALDKVYLPQKQESPRTRLRTTRSAAMYTLLCMLKKPVHCDEVREMVEMNLDDAKLDWQMYKALIPLLNEHIQVDFRNYIHASSCVDVFGLYEEDNKMALPAAPPCENRTMLLETIEYADMLQYTDHIKRPEESYMYLKELLSFTKFDFLGNACIKVIIDYNNLDNLCKVCKLGNKNVIYSPACNHFVSCCIHCKLVADSKCPTCNAQLPRFMFEIYDDYKYVVKGMEDDSIIDKNHESLLEHVLDTIEDGTFPESVINNVQTLYIAGKENKLLKYVHKIMGTEYKSQCNGYQYYSNAEIYKDVSKIAHNPNVTSFITFSDHLRQILPGTLCSNMLEFVRENPDHTVDQVINMVLIGRIKIGPSKECITCTEDDTNRLMMLSNCRHHVSCIKCLEKLNGDCPICRSKYNNFISIVPRRLKRKLDDESTSSDNKRIVYICID